MCVVVDMCEMFMCCCYGSIIDHYLQLMSEALNTSTSAVSIVCYLYVSFRSTYVCVLCVCVCVCPRACVYVCKCTTRECDIALNLYHTFMIVTYMCIIYMQLGDGITFHIVDVFLTELKKVSNSHVSLVIV